MRARSWIGRGVAALLTAGTGVGSRRPEEALRRVVATALVRRPGTRVAYSDVGPVVLWAAAERAVHDRVTEAADRMGE